MEAYLAPSLQVLAWLGLIVFTWSVSSSLEKIAASLDKQHEN